MKFRKVGKAKVYQIYCAGCRITHNINCDESIHGAFKYDNKEQTVSPSLKITSVDSKGKHTTCEFSISKGIIYYTKNSTHSLSGKSMELMDIKNSL